MKNAGGVLLFFGLVSILMHFMHYNFRILMWIDDWGEETGWGIRFGIALVGAALYIGGIREEKKAKAELEARKAQQQEEED